LVKRELELRSEIVCMTRVFSTLMARSNENKSCMRVDESWEARLFAWEFSQLLCPGRSNGEQGLNESLHESFLNSHAAVKREQELRESWWELTGYYHDSENSYQLSLKFEPKSMRVDKSAWEYSGQTRETRLNGAVCIGNVTWCWIRIDFLQNFHATLCNTVA
jgi:hypothetical protein